MLLFNTAPRTWQFHMSKCNPRTMRIFLLSPNNDFDATALVPSVLRSKKYNSLATDSRVTNSTSGPAQYRSKRVGSLFTAQNYYHLETRTLLTRHMQAPIANDDVKIPASRHGPYKPLFRTTLSTFESASTSWSPVHAVLPPLPYLRVSHNKPGARDKEQYFLTSVAHPTTYVTSTTSTLVYRRRHTIDAIQD